MALKAVVCIIFMSFIRLTDGNNVTLLPNGTAYVMLGDSLTLECIYSGTSSPFTFNFYLNPDTVGLQIRKSTCGILISTGYNTSLYSHSCNTSSVSLKILMISQSDYGQTWECDVSFITADPLPPKDSTVIQAITTTTVLSTSAPSSSTTTKEMVTATSLPSASMSSTTIKAITNSTSANPTATGSAATASISTSTPTNSATGSAATAMISTSASTNSATGSFASASSSTSTSKTPTAGSTANATISTSTPTNPKITGSAASASGNTSTSTSPTTGLNTISKSRRGEGGADTKVIVLAVVVPIGVLLLIGLIILFVVLCIRHHRAGKNGHEIPDGMAVQDKGNNVDGWEQSLGHDRTAKQPNAIQTTSDGFFIYPGPVFMSTARPNKEKKYPDVVYQYETPYPGTYGYQTAYVPSTYTYARSSTHKDTKHHNVGHPYSRPYTGTSVYQTAYGPSTYMSARTYPPKSKSYDYESPYRIAASRPAYNQTAYYPQTGYYGKISQDVYCKGGGHDSYGQRSRPHLDHSGRKQQREYYNQYEMTDYGGSRTRYGQTKQYEKDTAFYY